MKFPTLLTKQRKLLIAVLVLVGLTHAAINVSGAWLIKNAFERLQSTYSILWPTMAWFGVGFLIWAVIAAALRTTERRFAERLGQCYIRDIRLAVYDHMAALSSRALQHRSHGALMLRFVGDLTALRQWVSLGLARLIVASVASAGALAYLFFLNARLAASIGLILVLSFVTSVWVGEGMRDASLEARRRMAHLAANVNEKIASMRVVQAFGQSKRERSRIVKQSELVVEAMTRRAAHAGRLRAITDITIIFSYGATLLIGANELANGRTSVGIIFSAMTIVGMLMPILGDLGRVGEYWQNSKISRQKLNEFFKIEGIITENSEHPNLIAHQGSVTLKNVTLNTSVVNVSAQVEPGSFVAIIGPNGSGKSTLLALLARLIDPDEGEILIDEQNIHAHSLDSIHKAIGIAAPNLPLLRGTIERNIRYRCPDIDEEEVQRVIKLCRLDSLLNSLPRGLETKVAQGGHSLSSGQQQKITLARAILGQPKILLLDEADANLDAEACSIIDEIITSHQGTTIMVTHRLERLRSADMLWYMENGQLIESGSLADLLKNAGPAAKFLSSASFYSASMTDLKRVAM